MSALVLALIAGALVGLALGALGGGGSVLAVPALIYLLGFTPAAATTASLIIVTATSLTALYAHARTGNVRWKAGALFAAAGLLPAAAAGAAASRLPQPVLTAAFAAVAALAAVTMLRPSRATAAPAADGAKPVKAAGTGAGLGALTGLLGVGGGFLAVPALVTVLAFEMQAAVGTSLLVISANSLASLAARGAGDSGYRLDGDRPLHRGGDPRRVGRQTPGGQGHRHPAAANLRRRTAGRGGLHAHRRSHLTGRTSDRVALPTWVGPVEEAAAPTRCASAPPHRKRPCPQRSDSAAGGRDDRETRLSREPTVIDVRTTGEYAPATCPAPTTSPSTSSTPPCRREGRHSRGELLMGDAAGNWPGNSRGLCALCASRP